MDDFNFTDWMPDSVFQEPGQQQGSRRQDNDDNNTPGRFRGDRANQGRRGSADDTALKRSLRDHGNKESAEESGPKRQSMRKVKLGGAKFDPEEYDKGKITDPFKSKDKEEEKEKDPNAEALEELKHLISFPTRTFKPAQTQPELSSIRRSLEAPIKIGGLGLGLLPAPPAKKVEGEKEEELLDDGGFHEVLTYAGALHVALRILWTPMVFMGRLPFQLLINKNNRAVIRVKKASFPFIACVVSTVFAWCSFAWITLGLMFLVGKMAMKSTVLGSEVTSIVSVAYARRYWMDVFIMWTTMLQVCISSLHVLCKGEELATFVKWWYLILDLTKVDVSRTLKLYVIKSLMILAIFLLAIITQYFWSDPMQHVRATSEILVIALAQPYILTRELKDTTTRDADGKFYFQTYYSLIGLFIYLLSVTFAWLYIVLFMVFCRCFRKGLKGVNERIAMILKIDGVKSVGPNAVRISYDQIHMDYLAIAIIGMKAGRVFSWTMCNYYLWAIFVLVVELGEIFTFAKKDYRAKVGVDSGDYLLGKHGFAETVHPFESIVDSLIHFIITSFCLFYVSNQASSAFKEARQSYELGRYRGLVDCPTQEERNFIRSIWIVVSDKCPVHVSPGAFFGITNSTVMTVFVTGLTYFIFWVQSLGQLSALGT